MAMTDSGLVKSYPEISLEAMRRRLEPQYRVWLLARHLDRPGRGGVLIQSLRELVSDHSLYSVRVLERAIAKPSVFYERGPGHVWLHSLHKVAEALDVDLRDRPTWIPLADFASMFRLRQALVASYFAHKPRTVAIDTLAMLTGRSRRTVSRYLESEHIVKTPNVMSSRRDPHTDLTPEMAQEGYFHSRVAGKTVLVKRMPNTYTTDLEPAAYGQVKQQRLSPLSHPTGELRRRYYSHPKGAARALQALSPHETVFLLSGNCFDDLGFQLWRGFYCLDPHAPNHEL
ncbi:MAG: hypothetical protein KAX80_07730 [Planctomycetes bacterium]|nr:hypothetical protein [Planctomycetota bacterium]